MAAVDRSTTYVPPLFSSQSHRDPAVSGGAFVSALLPELRKMKHLFLPVPTPFQFDAKHAPVAGAMHGGAAR